MKKRFPFTEARVSRLAYDSDGPSRQIQWDLAHPGLGVRVYPSGKKSYVMQYGDSQSRRIIVLGSIYEHTLDEAADWWKAQRRKDREGVDLYEDKQRAKRAIREAKTVSDLIDTFLEEMENSWSVVHAKESRRRLTGPVRDAIGKKIPENVQRSDILNLHRKITERGAPVEANRVRSIVHAMFEYAADYEWVTDEKANPAKMRAKRGHNREQSRARKLNREEVAEVLRAANLVGNHRDGILLRLALLTGLRKSELRCRRWSDVDFQKRTLTVPDMGREVGGTKNRKGPFVLPLSGMAIGLLKSLPRSINPEGFIFPGKDGKKPLNDWKRPWERIRKESGVENMTYHDWRRTMASWLPPAGVDPVTVTGLLNQTPSTAVAEVPKVSDTYMRPMADAMREASEKMAELVAEVEPDENWQESVSA